MIVIDNIQSKYIVKNIFRSDNSIEGFTENHLLLLVYLQEFTTYRNMIYFNFSLMFEKLNITYHQLKKELYQCLIDLCDWGLIEIINVNSLSSLNQNTNITINRINYTDSYTLLVAEEIDKILYNEFDIRSRRTMLYVYVIICSWIGIKDRYYSFPRIDDFKRDINTTSNKRIISAIQQLKELGLIDYGNAGTIKNDNNIFQANNIYVLTVEDNYKDNLKNALEESKSYYDMFNK